jgi:hypothetical protein
MDLTVASCRYQGVGPIVLSRSTPSGGAGRASSGRLGWYFRKAPPFYRFSGQILKEGGGTGMVRRFDE